MGRGLLLSLKNLLFDVRSPWITSSSGIIVLVLFFFEILYTSKKNCSTNKKSQKVQDLTIRTYPPGAQVFVRVSHFENF